MSCFQKFVEFSKAMATILPKNYLPLFQQIADLLKKIGLMETLIESTYFSKNLSFLGVGGGCSYVFANCTYH